VIATKNDTLVTESEPLARNERRDVGIDLAAEIRDYSEAPQTDDVPVLRDDRAPVDALLDPMVGQRYVLEETEENGSDPPAPARIPADPLAPSAARASG
jgi:hypothetical protein